MAVREEESEYESDPEDAPLPRMRRREASDDEEGEGYDGRGKSAAGNRVGSDGELDGQGGAEVYDDEEVYYDEEEEEELADVVEEFVAEEGMMEGKGANMAAVPVGESPRDLGKLPVPDGDGQAYIGTPEENEDKDPVEEEAKENEPYAVPTAGAFYMHDDRFQDNGRGRRRRMFGVQKLWDPKDERAWVHDRFEEMNLQDTQNHEERRKSRGRFRGRGGGKKRGPERGYIRGNRSNTYHDDVENETRGPKTVRGRGPRRYELISRNKRDFPAIQSKHSPVKPQDSVSNNTSGRQSSQAVTVQSGPLLKKSTFASSLNSASPPFYPSGSSNQDMAALTQKSNVQSGRANKAMPYTALIRDNSTASQRNSLLKGNIPTDMVRHDKLFVDDSFQPTTGKSMATSSLQLLGSSLSPKEIIQNASSRVQGRESSIVAPPNRHSESSISQPGRVATQTKPTEHRPLQFPAQPAMQISNQQLVHLRSIGNQESSPPDSAPLISSDTVQSDSHPGVNKPEDAPVGKARIDNQGIGKGPFLYGGAQVIGATGAVGLANGDHNFPGTPALLPVMQLGGPNPGGMGLPAMGMALPGYVAQPQLGFGNSEMTWVPLLAGAAGALGAPYCPPYIALDGNYFARPSGQPSSSSSSRETGTSIPVTPFKPSQRPEVNEDSGQRQNKPRRYSEMNFGQ